MKNPARLALVCATVAATLLGGQGSAFARASSNVGHGMTCYTIPVVNADGSVSYTRWCFKRP